MHCSDFLLRDHVGLVALILFGCSSGNAQDTTRSDLIQQLRKELPAQVRQCENYISQPHFHIAGRVLRRNETEQKTYVEAEFESKRNGEFFLYRLEYTTAIEPDSRFTTIANSAAEARNSKYSFKLAKQNGQWIVDKVSMPAKSAEYFVSKGSLDHYFLRYISLSDWFENKDFEIVSAHIIAGRQNLKKFTFLAPEFDSDHNNNWFIIDSDRGWSIAGASYILHEELGATAKADVANEVIGGPGGCYLSTANIVSVTVNKPNAAVSKWRYESSTKYDFSKRPEEGEFTLSAFGLPEPEGVTWPKPAQSRWWLWIMIAAIACGLLSFAFLKLKRRRAAKQVP